MANSRLGYRVDVAWASARDDLKQQWSDITPYVRSINTTRGRQDEFSDIAVGTASVELLNDLGQFAPGVVNQRERMPAYLTSGGDSGGNLADYLTAPGAGFTLATSTAAPYAGSTHFDLTIPASSGVASIMAQTATFPVTEAGTAIVAFQVRKEATGSANITVAANLVYRDAAGRSLGTATLSSLAVTGTTYTTYIGFTAVPEAAVAAYLRIINYTGGVATRVYLDSFSFSTWNRYYGNVAPGKRIRITSLAGANSFLPSTAAANTDGLAYAYLDENPNAQGGTFTWSNARDPASPNVSHSLWTHTKNTSHSSMSYPSWDVAGPVTPGAWNTVRIRAKLTAGTTKTARIRVSMLEADWSSTDTVYGPDVTLSSSWQTVSFDFLLPAYYRSPYVSVTLEAPSASAGTEYTDTTDTFTMALGEFFIGPIDAYTPYVRGDGYRPVFAGTVETIPVRVDGASGLSSVTLTATDDLARFADAELLTPYQTMVMSHPVRAYLPMIEGPNTYVADASGNRLTVTEFTGVGGSMVTRGTDCVVPARQGVEGTSVKWGPLPYPNAGTSFGIEANTTWVPVSKPDGSDNGFTVECWVRVDPSVNHTNTSHMLFCQENGDMNKTNYAPSGVTLFMFTNGTQATIFYGFGTQWWVGGGIGNFLHADLYDGQPHHIVMEAGSASSIGANRTISLFVDGAGVSNFNYTGGTPPFVTDTWHAPAQVGGWSPRTRDRIDFAARGTTIAHVAVYASSNTNWLQRYQYMMSSAFVLQPERDRINLLADYVGRYLLQGDASKSQLSMARWQGGSALGEVSKAARSAGGLVYFKADGTWTYANRDRLRKPAGAVSPRAVFDSDTWAESGMPDPGFELMTSMDRIINDVTVTTKFLTLNVPAKFQYATSVAKYGRKSKSYDLDIHYNEAEIKAYAYDILNTYSEPRAICEGLDFNIGGRYRAWDAVLCLDITDRIHVQSMPPTVTASSYLALNVEQVSHRITMNGGVPDWRVSIRTSPAHAA